MLATDFGRVRDLDELTRLLGRAADVLDASGLMVWMGDASGGDLRPVLAHGYSSQMLARIPPVPRSADNAAAAAYRSGTLQIVLSRPGVVDRRGRRADPFRRRLHRRPVGGDPRRRRDLGTRPGARRHLRVAPRRRAGHGARRRDRRNRRQRLVILRRRRAPRTRPPRSPRSSPSPCSFLSRTIPIVSSSLVASRSSLDEVVARAHGPAVDRRDDVARLRARRAMPPSRRSPRSPAAPSFAPKYWAS